MTQTLLLSDVSFIAPDHGDRGEPDVKIGRTGGSAIGEDPRLVRSGVQVLARGALVCPECALPVLPAPRIGLRQELRCAYCDHATEARGFVREHSFDTRSNQVALIARLH